MGLMRKLFVVFLGFFLVKLVFSQQQYYIYIHAEEPRSFYVRSGSKLFKSSGNGYLVIPGLEKNTYELVIGFQDRSENEWRFNCTLSDSDLGFILKDGGEKGIELLALQNKQPLKGTLVNQIPQSAEKPAPKLQGIVSNDPFSSMLANVVNDQTIRQQLIIIETKQDPVAVQPSSANDSLNLLVASAPVQTPAVNEESKPGNAIATGTGVSVAHKNDALKQPTEKNEPYTVKESTLKDSVKTDPTPAAVIEKKTDHTTVAVAEKKYEPFVVREIQQTDSTKKSASSLADAQKSNSASTGAEKKQYEPFVVREITNKGSENTAVPPKDEAVKKANSNSDVSFLPFVVKPAGSKENATVDRPSEMKAEKRIDSAALTATETNKLPASNKTGNSGVEPSTSSGVENPNYTASTVPPKEQKQSTEKSRLLSSVKKTMERKSGDGIELIYIDDNLNGKKDTIRILIPVIK